MTDGPQTVSERYEQLQQQRRAAAEAMPSADAVSTRHAGLSRCIGCRVFDEVTRQEGRVIAGALTHAVQAPGAAVNAAVPASIFRLPTPVTVETVTVQLDDGQVAERNAAQLVTLPAGLVDSLESYAAVNPPRKG